MNGQSPVIREIPAFSRSPWFAPGIGVGGVGGGGAPSDGLTLSDGDNTIDADGDFYTYGE